jgi:hypothetical protein
VRLIVKSKSIIRLHLMLKSIRAFIFSEERILSGPSNSVVWCGESYCEVRSFSQMVSESDFLQASYIRRVSSIPNIHFPVLSSLFPRSVYSRTLLPQKKILCRWNRLFRFCPWYVPLIPRNFSGLTISLPLGS